MTSQPGHDWAPDWPDRTHLPADAASSTRLPAALSLVAAMTLTGANVAFGKAIVAEVPVYVFVLFRFVVASAALALMVRGEPGPKLVEMSGTERRDLALMALLGHGRLHGADVRGPQAHDGGRCRHHHGDPAGGGGGARRGVRGRSAVARAAAARWGWRSRAWCWCRRRARPAARRRCVGNLLVGGAVLCEASFVRARQAAGAALSAAAAGARRQPGRAGAGRAAGADRRGRPSMCARCGRRCGCSACGTRSRRASSACGCGIAACRTSRPGSPGSPRLPSRSPRLRRPRCSWARRSGRRGSPVRRW